MKNTERAIKAQIAEGITMAATTCCGNAIYGFALFQQRRELGHDFCDCFVDVLAYLDGGIVVSQDSSYRKQ